MNDALNTFVLSGALFRSDLFERPQVVDFIAVGDGGSIVALADWYQVDWVNYERLFRRGVPQFDGLQVTWPDEPSFRVFGVDNSEQLQFCQESRIRADLERQEYLRNLEALREAFGEFVDLEAWTKIILDRPAYNPFAEVEKERDLLRQFGRIFLVDAQNQRRDVLLATEDGEAVTMGLDPWLATIAKAWVHRDDRPTLEEFMQWLTEQSPYGPFRLDGMAIQTDKGTLQSIAERIFTMAS